jgi:hypothetical protein
MRGAYKVLAGKPEGKGMRGAYEVLAGKPDGKIPL